MQLISLDASHRFQFAHVNGAPQDKFYTLIN